jgi:hypothetical protein
MLILKEAIKKLLIIEGINSSSEVVRIKIK